MEELIFWENLHVTLNFVIELCCRLGKILLKKKVWFYLTKNWFKNRFSLDWSFDNTKMTT